MKKTDYQKEYEELAERYYKLEYEIIKRLDIIGDMVGWYIKKQEKKQAEEQMKRAKGEYEARLCEYEYMDMHYSNAYQDELRNSCQCEER